MKRNLVPLLGVALVAAVIATGIFYGLLLPRLQPASAAAAAPEPAKAPEAVPVGKRAISIHPIDSKGVMAMLQQGARVDIQVVEPKATPPQVRRILENVQVLRAGDGDLTVLVTQKEGDVLLLADASSQLRISLRNSTERPASQP